MKEKTGLEKMVGILEKKHSDGPISYALDWALKEARRLLKEEQEQNHTAPASLVGVAGRCKYQEDNKNCTAKSCPYHAIRGTTSDGTCILHPKPIGTSGPYLPVGRTCRSCLHALKCKELGIYSPDATMCDWDPCRYAEYHGDMSPEPMFMREICEALGWQGGTVHEAIKEIKRLKTMEDIK